MVTHVHQFLRAEEIVMAKSIAPYLRPHQAEALNPEVIDQRIADVEALARWMDYAFVLPGGFRYGLGGLLTPPDQRGAS